MDLRRLPWVRRLAADYLADFGRLSSFFTGDPGDRAAWRRMVGSLQGSGHPRSEIADILAGQQRQRAAPPEALASAERLRDPRAVAVLTGQQAGLFGGPLYTLLKALTALDLANRLNAAHGVPAVAVFWVEAEDHDWAEVASCSVLDADLALRKVTLAPPPGAGTVPVASITLAEGTLAAIDDLAAKLPPTEFTPALLTDLRLAYLPGTGVVEAFARWLETTLGGRGLVVFDSSDPAAKPLARPVFAREIERPGHTSGLARAAGRELVALGYHAQVAAHEDAAALFYLDGHRQPIRSQDGRFTVGQTSRPAEALFEEVERAPHRFSPNVLLRPIVQDTLFPTVSYVAGPNELGYLAQLGKVYEHFGLTMPLIAPRASLTLLDAAAARFLTRYEVALETLAPQDEASLNALLQSQLPAGVEESFQHARQAIAERMGAVIEAVPAIDPTLEGAARSTLGRIQHDLDTFHGKVLQAAKRRDDTLRRQYHRTRAQAFPEGHAQERSVGWVYFLNRYGPALVDRLIEAFPLDAGRHWVLTI